MLYLVMYCISEDIIEHGKVHTRPLKKYVVAQSRADLPEMHFGEVLLP